jgi:DDE superfamily endonuclease
VVVWDNLNTHVSGAMGERVAARDWLRVYQLPPYAHELNPVDGVREGWAAWDLTTPGGVWVEVKSAAYVQSWAQKELSRISFSTPRPLAWMRGPGWWLSMVSGARARSAIVGDECVNPPRSGDAF